MQYDAVIIGAGAAGLACARVLQENNLSCTVLESSNQVGGRIQTDEVDGFQLDHGFQVLQTGYPDVAQYLVPYSRKPVIQSNTLEGYKKQEN